MMTQVQKVMQWMHSHEGGEKDHSTITRYYESLAGIRSGR